MAEPLRCRACGKKVYFRDDETAGRHRDKSGGQCPGTGHPPAGDPAAETVVALLPEHRPPARGRPTIGWPVPLADASTLVCDSPSHQAQARAWVHGITGNAGVFRTFAEARAGR